MMLLELALVAAIVLLLARLPGAIRPSVKGALGGLVGLTGLGVSFGLHASDPWFGALGMISSTIILLPVFLCTFLKQKVTLSVCLASVGSAVASLVVLALAYGDGTGAHYLLPAALGAAVAAAGISVLMLSRASSAFNSLVQFRARTLIRTVGLALCLAAVLCSCLPSVALAHVVGLSASFSVAAGMSYVVVREPYLLLSYSVRKLLEKHPGMDAEQVRNLMAGVSCLLDDDAPVDLWIGGPDIESRLRLTSESPVPQLGEHEVPAGWNLGTSFALNQLQGDTTHILGSLREDSADLAGYRSLSEGLELSSIRPLLQYAQSKTRRDFGKEIVTASALMQSVLFKAVEQSRAVQWFLIAGDRGVGRTAVARVIAGQRQQGEVIFVDCGNFADGQTLAFTINELTSASAHSSSFGILCSGMETLNEQELTTVVQQLLSLPPSVAVYCRINSDFVQILLRHLSLVSRPPSLAVLDIPALHLRPIDILLQFCRFVEDEAAVQKKPIYRLESAALLEALHVASRGNSEALKRAAATGVAQSLAGVVWTTGLVTVGERV